MKRALKTTVRTNGKRASIAEWMRMPENKTAVWIVGADNIAEVKKEFPDLAKRIFVNEGGKSL